MVSCYGTPGSDTCPTFGTGVRPRCPKNKNQKGKYSMADSILKVTGLRKSYRKKIILNNVTFEVNSGEIIGIVGANGCGKSTLLRMLAGADKPDTGLIEYNGQISSKNPAQFKKYIGYIPQENPLFENLSVIDNLSFHYCGCMESLPPVMERFGLDKYTHYTVNKLSGGMKKRLSIACSLAGAPSILILDEPGASLDIVCKTDICDYLSNYSKNGGTVIITSHEECELALCSRMLFIENASIRELPPVTGTELMQLITKESLHA